LFALLYEQFISEAICQICSKSVEFYESYGKTHFGVFYAPQCISDALTMYKLIQN